MRALIVVDVQNDFLPTGPLPAQEGDQVVPVINALMPQFSLVVATQDWHPAQHASFASNQDGNPGDVIDLNGVSQILWPDHCVQDSAGAGFALGLAVDQVDSIVQKGMDPQIDSYSGFYDNQRLGATDLHVFLQSKDVDSVFIVGLCTDYCVKFTALDARDLGYDVSVIRDACRGADLEPGDSLKAIDTMARRGVHIIDSSDLISET